MSSAEKKLLAFSMIAVALWLVLFPLWTVLTTDENDRRLSSSISSSSPFEIVASDEPMVTKIVEVARCAYGATTMLVLRKFADVVAVVFTTFLGTCFGYLGLYHAGLTTHY